MKVDRNDPYLNATIDTRDNKVHYYSYIPLRLEIASRLLAGSVDKGFVEVTNPNPGTYKMVLLMADALIAAHNETCGEEIK